MFGRVTVQMTPEDLTEHSDTRATYIAEMVLDRMGNGNSNMAISAPVDAKLTFSAIYSSKNDGSATTERHLLGNVEGEIFAQPPFDRPEFTISSENPSPQPAPLGNQIGLREQYVRLTLNPENFTPPALHIEFQLAPSICDFSQVEIVVEVEVAGAIESLETENDVLDIGVPQCRLGIEPEAELTFPSQRRRKKIGVTETVKLEAMGAGGNANAVSWAITSGHGSLDQAVGKSVVYTAHETEEKATIEATDELGFRASIEFDVKCNYLLSLERLRNIFSTAAAADITTMANTFNRHYAAFGIDTCLRRAHFFAQVLTEIGTGAVPHEENLNYSEAALPVHFRYFRLNPAEATLYGRNAQHPADQPAIANRAYANRLGNGNIASGDGWRFRGRGYIQLTGRNNYNRIQREIDAQAPGSGVDIVNNMPDINTTQGGLLSAFAFWSSNNINTHADAGETDADVNNVTGVVNAHDPHPQRRRNNFHTTRGIFHTSSCPRRPGATP